MSESWIDPGSLDGDALTQWCLRSPAAVEQQRQAAASRRYQDFFYSGVDNDAGPQFGHDGPVSGQDIDPGFAMPAPSHDIDPDFAVSPPSGDVDPGFTWVADGPNRFRSVWVTTDNQPADPSSPATNFDDGVSSANGGLLSNVSYRPPASPPPLDNSPPQAGAEVTQPRQQPAIDPSKTPVFQTGPDGKLHPVPGWHTTGPFDFAAWSHNIHWGGVAKDLGEIAAGIPAFFSGMGAGADLLAAFGPEAETAVAEGIGESPAVKTAAGKIQRHHLDPKYMGGAEDGERYELEERLHQEFHSMLGKAHSDAGFPPRGGITGSKAKWGEYYDLNPGSRDEAYEILRRVARKFDEMHGTDINSRLSQTPGGAEVRSPPPK